MEEKIQIGKIKKVPLREIWKKEDKNFTTWLQNHINYLNDIFDFDLEIVKKEKKLGTKYFEWDIKGDSIVAKARKENPYEHYCPITHSIKIFKTIESAFDERDLINAELIHQKLLGDELDANRKYKGKAEEYKIRMMISILELKGLLGWTGSKKTY